MSKRINLNGKSFGRLTAIGIANSKDWLCRCSCGKFPIINGSSLRRGLSKSCGCLKRSNIASGLNTKHGRSRTRTYRIWAGIKTRCLNPRSRGYAEYGGRGITIDPMWLEFENFYRDMGDPPSGHSIERKDGTKGYSAENCRWATPEDQANNTRNNRLLEFAGETHTLAEWSRIVGVSQKTISTRLVRGWTVGQSIGKEGR